MRCYLVSLDEPEIYPSFRGQSFEPILGSAGCIPLLWLCLFSPEDFKSTELSFEDEEGVVEETVQTEAPVAGKATCLERLAQRRSLLGGLFASNGGLDHHIELFSTHLAQLSGRYLSVEWVELDEEFEEEGGAPLGQRVRDLLAALESGGEVVRDELASLSTVVLERRFLSLGEAQASDPQDAHNYFRIMGEGWSQPSPWD